MGEHEGYLRIATSSGFNGNYVTVLKNEGAALKIVGKVDDIAPGEDIKAVRFVGDRGYVVTFKKIDPLFVLDMSDPEDPVVTGELKVPGFSTYLHLLDREHLIGLGKDGDDQGAFAWFQGLKLSLFDVADSSTPKEDSSVTIGSRGTMSPAFDDHLAFTFDRETGLLALPLTLCEGTKGGSKVGSFSYNGVQVYNISANGGISMVGEIKDTTAADAGNGNYYSLCNGWNYTGNIQRTVILKDGAANHIATIALDGVKIYTLGGEIESSVSW